MPPEKGIFSDGDALVQIKLLQEANMQWIIALEADNNPIVLGRLLNVLRRKGIGINTLTLGTRTTELSLMALVESPEESVEHVFNFLRRMEGIRDVTYYRRESSGMASFIFIETDDNSAVAKILGNFPLSKLVFASQGKYLVEIGERRGAASHKALATEPGFLSFARVRTSSLTAGMSDLTEA